MKKIKFVGLAMIVLLCGVVTSRAQTQVTRLSTPNTTGEYFSYTSIALDTGFSTAPGQTFHAYILPAGCVLLASSPSLTQNYIRTSILRTAGVKNVSALNNLNTCEVMQSIQYIDGLGRPIQTVQVKGNQDASKDIVQPLIYDELGRETYKFLPYASGTAANGSFRSDAILQQASYYNPSGSVGDQLPNGAARNTHPYSVTLMELSPMSKVLEQGAPGEAWQPYNASLTASGHTVRATDSLNNTKPLTDTANSRYVALYKISAIGNTDQSRTLSRGSGSAGYYSANQLMVSITRDENWKSGRGGTTEAYKDKSGQVVLKRTFNYTGSALQILSTYYVYDDMGLLAYVLPPKSDADNAQPSQTILDNLCYQYRYDDRGRMTQKKLPGKGWEYIVYNKLDQVVYTQDSIQRASNQWSWMKYDAMGRPALSGIENNNSSARSVIQNTYINTQTTLWESRNNSRPEGYTIAAHPQAGEENTNIIIHSINYYDDYSFPGSGGPYPFAGGSQRNTGLLTGSRTAVLKTPAVKLWTVNYYDDEGRNIKTYKRHYLNEVHSNYNYDEITTGYNFSDQPITSTRKHYVKNTGNTAAILALTLTNDWDYDHTGRKTNSWQQITNSAQQPEAKVLVSQTVYNEVGQLWKRKLHSENTGTSFLQEIINTYNERGWLLAGNTMGNMFNYSLSYNNPNAGVSKQYNGNISQMTYTRSGTTDMVMQYSYDELNRLKTATSTGNVLNESLTYDVMGNIMSLVRTGDKAANLTYGYYNSNQDNRLQTVQNNSAAFRSYTYDANGNATSNGESKTIVYNLLNLPKEVKQGTTTIATYSYDAAGTKLRNTGSDGTWDYIDGIIYKNGAISFIQTEEGRAELLGGFYHYEYNLEDHLGNTRVSFDKHPTTGLARRIQEDEYYAFGLRKAGGYDLSNNNRYLYNGKELQTDLTEQFDYGARFYDPVIARWNVLDPKSELLEMSSSYVYSLNSPVNFIDKDGELPIYINGKTSNDGERGAAIYWNTQLLRTIASSGIPNPGGTVHYVDGNRYLYQFANDVRVKKSGALEGQTAEGRREAGYKIGKEDFQNILSQLARDPKTGKITEKIQIYTHSRGAAFGVGYTAALLEMIKKNSSQFADANHVIDYVLNVAPHQSNDIAAPQGANSFSIDHDWDMLSGDDMGNNIGFQTTTADGSPFLSHKNQTFAREVGAFIQSFQKNKGDNNQLIEDFVGRMRSYGINVTVN